MTDAAQLDAFALQTDEPDAAFVLSLDGFEGPLHILLSLARDQKVDLRRISILALAEQYLTFVADAKGARIDLAAEYLVMAAWLAWLKSRLLLPRPAKAEKDEDSPEALARALADRLQKLDQVCAAAQALFERPQFNRDVFSRQAVADQNDDVVIAWRADLYDLMKAYAVQRNKAVAKTMVLRAPIVLSLEAARLRLRDLLGAGDDWRNLSQLVPSERQAPAGATRASRVASMFAAALELTKEGAAELHQAQAFGPIRIRRVESA